MNNLSNHSLYHQHELITRLQKTGTTDNNIIQAFQNTPRHLFVTPQYQPQACLNIALPIGYGQTTSPPSLLANILQKLQLAGTENILEIGTGTGYFTAILSQLSKHVHTIERIPHLLNIARKNHHDLKLTNIDHHLANGTLGLPQYSPFNTIIVTATSNTIPPQLIDQLAINSKIAIPLSHKSHQHLIIGQKTTSGLHIISSQPILYIPPLTKNTHHH